MFSDFVDGNGVPAWDALLEQGCIFQALTFNDQATATNVIGICGGGQILRWDWLTGSWPPSLVMYRQGNILTIHVTGTENLSQLYGDVIGVFAVPYTGLGCKVHTFFQQAWLSVRARIVPSLPTDWRDCEFRFFGHSLGAAVAYLGSLEWKRDNPTMRVQLLTTAMPKALTVGYNGFLPNTCNFVASPDDVVPIVPVNGMNAAVNFLTSVGFFSIPFDWVHYATGYFLRGGNANLERGTADDFNYTPSPAILGTTAIEHFFAEYLAKILLGWSRYRGVGQDLNLVSIASMLATSPAQQTLVNNIDATQYIDVPQQNILSFESVGPGPLTNENLLSVNSISGAVTRVSRTDAIFPVLSPSGGGMADSKMTVYMRDGAGSFSESFFRAGLSPDGVTAAMIMNFTDCLVPLLGTETFITKVRVSTVGSARLVKLWYLPALRQAVIGASPVPADYGWQGIASGGGHTTAKQSDAPGTSLLLRKQSGLRFSRWFLRGIPDDIVQAGGAYVPFPRFSTNLTTMAQQLATGWSWYGVLGAQPDPAPITNAVTQLDSTCLFTLGSPLFNGVPLNTRKVVRISGQRSPGNLNGNVTVQVVSATQARTVRPLSVNNFVLGTGLMRFTNVGFIPITGLTPERIVTKRAGRPTDQSPGRSKARPRG